jgi:hypothetical protein
LGECGFRICGWGDVWGRWRGALRVERVGQRGGEGVGEGARMLGASGPAPNGPRALKRRVVSVGLVGPPSMHLSCV